jgi:protein disulfide-isomerase
MKRAILLLVLGCLTWPARAEELVQWFTDLPAAQDKARRENKAVLLDFTGSDWCGWCMKLKAEVFDQPDFAAFARANLVLVEVDFPHHKHMDGAQKQANEQLAQSYGITGFPTVILLDSNGQLAGKTGYRPGGPGAFNAEVAHILRLDVKPQPVAPPPEPERPRKPVTFTPPPPQVPNHYGAVALKGISGTKDRRLALINNQTLMVGETGDVKVEDHFIVVSVKEIHDNYVVVTVDDKPMELKLKP